MYIPRNFFQFLAALVALPFISVSHSIGGCVVVSNQHSFQTCKLDNKYFFPNPVCHTQMCCNSCVKISYFINQFSLCDISNLAIPCQNRCFFSVLKRGKGVKQMCKKWTRTPQLLSGVRYRKTMSSLEMELLHNISEQIS